MVPLPLPPLSVVSPSSVVLGGAKFVPSVGANSTLTSSALPPAAPPNQQQQQQIMHMQQQQQQQQQQQYTQPTPQPPYHAYTGMSQPPQPPLQYQSVLQHQQQQHLALQQHQQRLHMQSMYQPPPPYPSYPYSTPPSYPSLVPSPYPSSYGGVSVPLYPLYSSPPMPPTQPITHANSNENRIMNGLNNTPPTNNNANNPITANTAHTPHMRRGDEKAPADSGLSGVSRSQQRVSDLVDSMLARVVGSQTTTHTNTNTNAPMHPNTDLSHPDDAAAAGTLHPQPHQSATGQPTPNSTPAKPSPHTPLSTQGNTVASELTRSTRSNTVVSPLDSSVDGVGVVDPSMSDPSDPLTEDGIEDDDPNYTYIPKKGSACVICYRAKTSCDGERPCFRCVRLHKSSCCEDRPKDERHPRKRKGIAQGERGAGRKRRYRRTKPAAAAASTVASLDPSGVVVDDGGSDSCSEGGGSRESTSTSANDRTSSSSTTTSIVSNSKYSSILLKLKQLRMNKELSSQRLNWYLTQLINFLEPNEFQQLIKELPPIEVAGTITTTTTTTKQTPTTTNNHATTDGDNNLTDPAVVKVESDSALTPLIVESVFRNGSHRVSYDASPLICIETDRPPFIFSEEATSSLGCTIPPLTQPPVAVLTMRPLKETVRTVQRKNNNSNSNNRRKKQKIENEPTATTTSDETMMNDDGAVKDDADADVDDNDGVDGAEQHEAGCPLSSASTAPPPVSAHSVVGVKAEVAPIAVAPMDETADTHTTVKIEPITEDTTNTNPLNNTPTQASTSNEPSSTRTPDPTNSQTNSDGAPSPMEDIVTNNPSPSLPGDTTATAAGAGADAAGDSSSDLRATDVTSTSTNAAATTNAHDDESNDSNANVNLNTSAGTPSDLYLRALPHPDVTAACSASSASSAPSAGGPLTCTCGPFLDRPMCVHVNREWERLFGYKQAELRTLLIEHGGKAFLKLFRSDSRNAFIEAALESLVKEQNEFRFYAVIINKWLAEIHCLMSIRIGDVDLDSVMSCDPSSSPVVGSTAALPPSDHCPTFIVTITPLLDPRPPPLTKNTNGNANNTE